MCDLEHSVGGNGLLLDPEITNSVNRVLSYSALFAGATIVFGEEVGYAADGRTSTGSIGGNGSGENVDSEDGANGSNGAGSEDGQDGEESAPGRNGEDVTGEEDGEDVDGTADGSNGTDSDDAKDGTDGESSLSTQGSNGDGKSGKPSVLSAPKTQEAPTPANDVNSSIVVNLSATAPEDAPKSEGPMTLDPQNPALASKNEGLSGQGGSIHETAVVGATDHNQATAVGGVFQAELQPSKPIPNTPEVQDNFGDFWVAGALVLTGIYLTVKDQLRYRKLQ